MPNDKDSNARFEDSVYDGVREDPEGKYSAASRSWRAEAGVFDQQLGNAFELAEKALCYERPGLCGVEIQGVRDVMFGARV